MMISFFYMIGMLLMANWLSSKFLVILICLMMMYSVLMDMSLSSLLYIVDGPSVGGDIISFSMVVLSMYIVMLMLMGETKVKNNENNMYKILVLMILLLLILCFYMLNVFCFYLFFELVLIPMVLLILMLGYQPERFESGIYMFMYTMFGSLPLLIGVLLLSTEGGSLSFLFMMLNKTSFVIMWDILLLVAFLVKLPMYMFHIWLPKAHVEAPVSGSMILAGVLLKLGCYGLIRFYPFLHSGVLLKSFLVVMGLWGGLMSAFMCLRQLDMKKLVAYSSVVHMGLFLSGLISGNLSGVYGGLMMMIGHGLCSSGLFYLVNSLYERIHSRSLLIVKGAFVMSPSMMSWGFLLSAANMAAPPFLTLFGEILLGMSVLVWDLMLGLVLLGTYFIGVAYGIYFYSVISHGKMMKYLVIEAKVNEYLILFLHFMPILLLIFLLKNFSLM